MARHLKEVHGFRGMSVYHNERSRAGEAAPMAPHTVTEQKDQGWIRLSKDQFPMTFFLVLLIEAKSLSPGWSQASCVVELCLKLLTLLTLLPT